MVSSDNLEPTTSVAGVARRCLFGLARMTPGRLVLSMWLCVFAASALTAFQPTAGLGTALVLAVFSGYPYALILGMPEGVIRKGIVSAARKMLAAFLLLLLLLVFVVPFFPNGYSTPMTPTTPTEWMEYILGLAVNAVVFGPFFLGAAALNDVRQAMKQPTAFDSIPNFLTLFAGLCGGLLFAHRPVRQYFGFESRPPVDSMP